MQITLFLYLVFFMLFINACNKKSDLKISSKTVAPASSVTFKGKTIVLYKGSISLGDNVYKKIPQELVEKIKGDVAIISVVPSLETKVCEAQTHRLGESNHILEKIKKVTISRDLPMAQERFANDANLKNIIYHSDYKFGSFGKSTGLMMKGKELLARAIIVVDTNGIIKHMQIVPEITTLPDMNKAIDIANRLVK